ncbi:MAG: ATP-dependent helicase [Gemmatimonadota bacterium]|nr:ATP-dependent helicase [Gemmatimonadota bacterium]
MPADAPATATTATDFVAELNPDQRAAAVHGDGPLLIVAGAGTGKTRTLVYRVAHLIERGVRPERILLLTFTRRASQEMLGRVGRLVGGASQRVSGGTFHATAHRLLRAYGLQAGIARDFTILDQGDSVDLMALSRANLGFAQKKSRFPKKESLQYVYSRHVNTEITVDDIIRDELPQFIEDTHDIIRVFADYVSRKGERNLVDYDDLLLFWAGMLESSEQLGAKLSSLYDHILVDEYQDTNVLQARILRGMCRTHKNITVVGDDAQSIYSFRGATVRNILDFPAQFPGATMVTLEQNYRSTQPILDVTNAVIARATERFTKNLWTKRGGGEQPWLVAARDEHEQTQWIVDRILELNETGTSLREMAVLFRAGYMSADLEIELTNRKIPFEKWGGLKFLEAAHVKDVLAFLRILENPRDEVSWYRVLQLLPGIGDATARRAIDIIASENWDAGAIARVAPPPRAREAHEALSRLVVALSGESAADAPVSVQIAEVRKFYDAILKERYDRAQPRLADLDQLEIIAANFPSRSAFLSELALEPPSSTQDQAVGSREDDDCLILSTAHSAKGREWDAVFVIWAVDGWFPSSRSLKNPEDIEEERRLMYVALTRARDHLVVSYPLNVYSSRFGGDYSMDQVSRFVDRGIREKMRRIAAYGATTTGALAPNLQPAAVAAPPLDLRALLRGRFGGS